MDPRRRQVLAAFADAISMGVGNLEGYVSREVGLDLDTVDFLRDGLIRDNYLARGSPKRDGSGRIYDPGRLRVTAQGGRELEEG